MPNAPADQQVARFAASLDRLSGGAPAARFGIAVSGGADSLALLLLAHAACPDRIAAATVDHQLRAQSADEARGVHAVCAALGVPHAILTPPTAITGSVQAGARAARYQLLGTWAEQNQLDYILTAHHADDQAETLVMRLNRGAGLAGLSGVRATNRNILRPLLDWRRDELAAIVSAAGLTPIDDPSNRDARYDRARLRAQIATADWLDPRAIGVSAAALADAEAAIGWSLDRLWQDRVDAADGALTLCDPDSLPREYQRRLLLRAITALDPACTPSGPALERVRDALQSRQAASIGALLARATLTGWELRLAPPRRTI